MLERLVSITGGFIFRVIGLQRTIALINLLIRGSVSFLPPTEALRQLFKIENQLYILEGQFAVEYGGGIHTKHRHTNYHDFFVENINDGDTILDLGCGIGAVSFTIARETGCSVTGIDLSSENIAKAKKQFNHPLVTYVQGDVLKTLPKKHFDIVVLSNVLEHLSGRVLFLRKVMQTVKPHKILIRVPLFERDWRVPLKKELGVDWRLDPTHETEYTQAQFQEELASASLKILKSEVHWGEIWAIVIPSVNVVERV